MLRADVAQRRYTAAMDFVEVSTDILVTSIEGVFSAMRDLVFNGAGMDDPKAKEKLDHSEKVMDAQMRIALPVNKLKLVGPSPAPRLNTSG